MAAFILGNAGRLAAGILFPGSPTASFLFGAAGAALGNLLFPDSKGYDGPSLKDLKVTASTYGAGIPITYGSVRIAGNMIWAEDLVPVHSGAGGKKKGGKGGFGVPRTPESVDYYGVFAVAFCEGPVEAVRRIWADSELIVDLSDGNATGATHRYGDQGIRIYLGDETQSPDPVMESYLGAGEVPGHRGLCYVVFDHLPLADFGNRIPNLTAEIVRNTTLSFAAIDHTDTFPASLASDRWAIDPVRPYLWNAHGDMLMRVNRLTGEVAFQKSLTDIDEFMDAWNGIGGGAAPSTDGLPFVDPVTGMVLVGVRQTTVEALAVFDEELRFRDLDSNGIPTRGRVVPFGVNSFVFVQTRSPSQLVSYLLDRSGKLTPIETSTETATWGTDFAFDLLRRRGWALTSSPAYNDTANLTPIKSDGTFGTRLSSSDLGIASSNNAYGLVYDQLTDSLILILEDALHRFDPDTLALQETAEIAVAGGFTDSFYNAQDLVSGVLRSVKGTSLFYEIDTRDLSIRKTYDIQATHGLNLEGPVWDGQVGALWTFDAPGQYQIFFDRHSADDVPLGDIVADLCRRADLAASEIETVSLTQQVAGYVLTPPLAARRAIEPLQLAFGFDGVETDYRVLFEKRGGASVASLSEAELVAEDADAQANRLVETRAQEVELPVRVTVDYMVQANDYQTGTQQARRIQDVTGSVHALKFELPIVLSNGQAKRSAARLLASAWGERRGLEFRLPPSRLALDAGDVATIDLAGSAESELRINELTVGADGVLMCRGVVTDPGAYEPEVTEAEIAGAPADGIKLPVPSRPILLDTPVLDYPNDDDGGFYAGAAPSFYASALSWVGAELYRSDSEEEGYASFGTFLTATPWFVAQDALGGTARWTVWDDVNTLTVRMQTGDELESVTDLDVLNGANAVMLGDEVVQFATATLIGERTYLLSRLLRGRAGTENAVGSHQVGEIGVVLSETSLSRVCGSADIAKTYNYRALTIGQATLPSDLVAFTAQGAALKPYAPAHVAGSRDGSGNLTVSFVRRTRFNGGLRDGTGDVPLNEDSEAYQIDVYASASVVRTLATGSTQAVYTASAQLADFGSVQAEIAIGVFQISAQIGRGHEGSATL